MTLRGKITKYLSDNIALFDCQGSCPDEVAINNDLRTDKYCNICFAERIITLVKEAGWVKLANDQSLPDGGFYETTPLYNEAVRIMLRAGWRKVEPNAHALSSFRTPVPH